MAAVLIVDSDPMRFETQAALLEAGGYEVLQAVTGSAALELLNSSLIDLVIIEPDSQPDSGELCQAIRRRYPYCPLMFLSDSAREADVVEALAGAADDFLVRPVSPALFRARVQSLLRRADHRLTHADRQFSAMRRMLESAWEVPLKPAIRSPFPDLARALGESLRATYCRLAVRDGNRLVVRASAGPRLPAQSDRGWRLTLEPYAREALAERRSVVVDFRLPDVATTPEREQLFSVTTRVGVLIPFRSDRFEGLLIVGEERGSRADPFEAEHLAMLEYVAHRIGDILRMSDLMRRDRLAERRRQLLTVKRAERARLARELHDEVGQSLSGLLLRLRLARRERSLTLAELDVLEKAAQGALDASRAVAYDLRRQSGAGDAFEDARDFAQTVLSAAGCRVVWTDERGDAPLDVRTARTAARVIKESVTNVVRHSSAKSAEIKIEEASRRLRVTIRDDGQGFIPAAVPLGRDGRGLGLLGNRERLAQLGGTFRVDSLPGAGTSVTLELPWRPRAQGVARVG